MRIVDTEKPLRILITNSKGGCGKSTVATNLAGHYAGLGFHTAIIDHDPQGSSSHWLKVRDSKGKAVKIYNVHAAQKGMVGTRSWQRSVPANVQRIIIDTPAGVHGNELEDLIRDCDIIIIPVLPSPIDIRAAAGFIGEILLNRSFRNGKKRIGVIANRARKNTIVYGKLQLFLKSLKIPFICTLRDSQNYVVAADLGSSVFEISTTNVKKDCDEWEVLTNWLNCHKSPIIAQNQEQQL